MTTRVFRVTVAERDEGVATSAKELAELVHEFINIETVTVAEIDAATGESLAPPVQMAAA